jgi:hypothetical protein
MMRRTTLLAAATAAAALSLAPAAGAQTLTPPAQDFAASVSPARVGTAKKPTNLSLKVRPFFDQTAIQGYLKALTESPGSKPFSTSAAIVKFDKSFVFNGKRFPTCTADRVRNGGGKANCPRGALVGKGLARAFAPEVNVNQFVSVEIWNGPAGGNVGQVLLKIKAIDDPQTKQPFAVDVNDVLVGDVTKVAGDAKYGYQLKVSVPEQIQFPAPGTSVIVTDFDTTTNIKPIKRGKKTFPYISLNKCGAEGKLWFSYTATYSDGTSQSKEVSQSCRGR